MMKIVFKNSQKRIFVEIEETKVLSNEIIENITQTLFSDYSPDLWDVYIPEGIRELEDYAFISFNMIKHFYLPASLTTVTAHAFAYNPVESIKVHPKNTQLCSQDGVLYSKDLSKLIYYPRNKAGDFFATPVSVRVVARAAFAGVKKLKYFSGTKDIEILENRCFINSDIETVDLSVCDKIHTIPSWCFTLCRNNKFAVKLPPKLKEIKQMAFDASALTEVQLPDSIERLERNAFSRNHLKTIKLPQHLEVLGDRVFACNKNMVSIDFFMVKMINKKAISDCSNLREFSCCDKDNKVFSTIDGVLYDKRSNTLLKCPPANEFNNGKLVIPDGTKVIDLAFDSCNKLTEVYIPDSVETIKRGAFYKCSALKKIHIGKSCSSFDMFDHCHNIEYVEVSVDNPFYTSVDGVVYSKDKQKLIYYPRAKANIDFTIPYGVTEIGSEAFKRCNNLKDVAIPSSVLNIGASSFEACKNLTCVNMTASEEDSIIKIGECAFAFCENLRTFHVPNRTLVGDYSFVGCTNLTELTKGSSVFYGKHSFALTPFKDAQSADFGLLKQILEKMPTKRKTLNKFQGSKKYWGE